MNAGRGWGRVFGMLATGLSCLTAVSATWADEPVDAWVGGMLAMQGQSGVASPEGVFGDLSLTLSDSPDPAPVGSSVTYQATVNYSSTLPGDVASSVQLVFFYTAGMVFQSSAGAGWSCTGGTIVQCNFAGTLTAPQSTQVSLQFQMPATPQSVQLRGTGSYMGAPENNPANNTNITQTTQVVAVGGTLNLGLQGNPATVTAGAPVSYTAQVSNAGPGDLSGVSLSGTSSGPVNLNGTSGTGWSCSNSTSSFTCNYGPTLLAGNSTPNLVINGTSGPGAGLAQLNATANAAGATGSASQSASINVQAPPAVTLSKTDSTDPVQLGQNFFYTLTATNSGGTPLQGLTIIDNLPPELDFIGSSGAGWSCSAGSSAINCLLGTPLAPGSSSSLRIDVRAVGSGEVTNSATISDDQGTVSANASQSTTIVSQAQVSFSKRASRSQVTIGDRVNFDLVVRNTGQVTASNLQLSDRIPDGLSFVSASGSGWSCNTSAVTVFCSRATLAAGAESTVSIEVEAIGPAGSIVNVGNLSVAGGTPQPASAAVTVVEQPAPTAPDLALSKSDDVDPVNIGNEFSYVLTVSNSGGPATGLTLIDDLPAGLSLISASGPGWTCSGSSMVSCSFAGSLATGASTQVTIRVRAPSTAGNLLNQASVSTAGETNTANNSDSESTQVVSDGGGGQPLRADLALQGSASLMSALPDATVSFSLQPSNNGPDRATASAIAGQVQQGLVLLSAEGAGYNCMVQGSSFDCSGPPLAPGPGPALVVSARVSGAPGSTARLSAQVESPLQDPDPLNNQTSVSLLVETPPPPQGADLSLNKQASANPVEAGAAFSYTLTVSNAGPAAATQVLLVDNLPDSLTFVSVQGSGLNCGGGATVTCQAAQLAAGASASVIINVRAPNQAGDVQNNASVSAATSDPNPANNSAAATVGVDERSADSIEQELTMLTVNDPTASAAAEPVSQICSDPSPAFADQCRILLQAADEGRVDDVAEALRAIAPDEVLGQTAAVLELADRQFVNVDARLAELRGGSGGFSLSGLTVVSGGTAVPLSLFQGLFDDPDEIEVGGSGDLISPWGGFINGTISWGDQDLDNSNSNVTLDYDSWALTAGVDYRFSYRTVAGVALGYSNFDSELTEQGELQAKGYTLSAYGSHYLSDRFYLDGRVSYNIGSLDHVRFIRFGSGGDRIDLRATGDTDSSQLALAIGAGYHYNTGPWVITPSGYVRYIDVSVDGFTEAGAGANSAIYSDQDISTLQAGFGISVTRAFSFSHGVISPQLDLNFVHESTDDLRVQARLVGADPTVVFGLEPDDPDQSYGNIGLGFVYVTANGRQAYLSYRETFGQDGLSSGTLNLGARFEF